ncbi:MAG: zinc ribbon domain-containing protein [Pyrinomonadaceae bacterium]
MEEKVRCQSCGMPIDAAFKNLGTEIDGSPASEYCMFCYQSGGFTNPAQTVDEMVKTSTDFMTANLGYEREQAAQMSNDVIRGLKRWN